MSQARASRGRIKADILIRDRHGRPKVSPDRLEYWWPKLNPKDQAYLREQYPNHPIFVEE